jgi:hypothetical protein
MTNRLIVTATVMMLLPAASAFAQRVEVSVTGGWTLSDGVSGDPILAGDGNLYDRVDSKDSGSWGFGVGVNASDNAEVGFLFGQQLSTLEISGTTTRDVGDLTVNSYHGYFAYNVARQMRARGRTSSSALAPRTSVACPSPERTVRAGGDGRRDAVLDDVGRWRQGLSCAKCGSSVWRPVDTNLHQD